MVVESFLLDPTPDFPAFITAKRYWEAHFANNADNPAALTLVLLHSTSFHKETWEPTLYDLFALLRRFGDKAPAIREAWVVECPNHGLSGQMNKDLLLKPGLRDFSCLRYAEAVHRFLTTSPSWTGPQNDFRKRNLVGIGHSLGANAMLILQHLEPRLVFSKLIIIEPMLTAAGPRALEPLRDHLVARARKRVKLWDSRDAVRRAYTNNPNRSAAKWDARVMDLFLEFGLHWNEDHQKYELSCTPDQEVAMYRDPDGSTMPVVDLNLICHKIPVHLILGKNPDFIPNEVHEALYGPKSGRQFASITWMDAGHLVPQEIPTALSAVIYDALGGNPPSRL